MNPPMNNKPVTRRYRVHAEMPVVLEVDAVDEAGAIMAYRDFIERKPSPTGARVHFYELDCFNWNPGSHVVEHVVEVLPPEG